MDFEQAYKRLKEINTIVSNQSVVDVDTLVDLQKEAEKLFEFCKEKISHVEEKISDE